MFHVGAEPAHAALMIASVRKHLSEYRLVQLTDMETSPLAGMDEVIRREREPDLPLFVFRAEHFAHCPYSKWLALDTDVLIRRGVDDVWARGFDVALTTRRELICRDPNGVPVAKSMPFNTGVIFSRNPEFWVRCRERMNPPYRHGWYTDQLAVADVAQSLEFHVLVLPGEEFNWTPAAEWETSEARIWHYKGNRKEWMLNEQHAEISTGSRQSGR